MSSNASAASPTPPRRSLARDGDFLRFWAAETISHLGSSITGIALPLVAIKILDAGASEVALLNLADFLPFLLIGLIAGAVVDRLPRRAVLVAGDLGRAALLALIPLAHLGGWLSLPLLLAVGFLVGTLTVFFDVAYQSFLPSLIRKEDLVEGNSKLEVSRTAAQLAGPAAGGSLLGLIAAPLAILVDAASFALSALFIFSIRGHGDDRPAPAPDADGARRSLGGEIGDGVRFVFGHPALRTIGAATATSNLFGTIGNTLLVLFAVRELDMSPALIGLTFSLSGVGGLLAALSAGRITRRLGVGPTIVLSIPWSGPLLAAVALGERGNDLRNVALVAASGFAGIASGTLYNINQVSYRQAITPEPMQGRMNATMRWFVWGTIPVGALLGGLIGETLGLRPALLIGGIGATFAFVPLLFGPVWKIRTMPEGA
jgi:MFS family permease